MFRSIAWPAAALLAFSAASAVMPEEDAAGAESIGYRHITYHLATGERIPGEPSTERLSDVIWQAASPTGHFFRLSSCSHTPVGQRPEEIVLDWGDLPAGSMVSGMRIAYATDAPAGPDAVTLTWTFLNNSNGFNNNDFDAVAASFTAALPGRPAGWPYDFVGWFVTFDLAGSGTAFPLGDMDIDGDGLADFAYTFTVRDASGATATGPLSGGDPNDPLSMGIEDAYDRYLQDPNHPCVDPDARFFYDATLFFNNDPFAQVYMVLYGDTAGCPAAPDCPQDIDGNGVVGLSDLSLVLEAFGCDAQDACYNPCADLTESGSVGLGDLSQLLGVFGLTCPTR